MKHITYQKINCLYNRNPVTKRLNFNEFCRPEFDYLYSDNTWICREKIDGTNVSCYWDGVNVEFHGKTKNAIIPKYLLVKMQQIFTKERLEEIWPIERNSEDGSLICPEVRIYGKGYGTKIQKGDNYIKGDCNVILFDVMVNNWWLKDETVAIIADRFGLKMCPIIEGIDYLWQAEALCTKGFKSLIAENKDYEAEGVVCKPAVPLFDRDGNRIICKIKTVDYKFKDGNR
jgi:hypothetical protein